MISSKAIQNRKKTNKIFHIRELLHFKHTLGGSRIQEFFPFKKGFGLDQTAYSMRTQWQEERREWDIMKGEKDEKRREWVKQRSELCDDQTHDSVWWEWKSVEEETKWRCDRVMTPPLLSYLLSSFNRILWAFHCSNIHRDEEGLVNCSLSLFFTLRGHVSCGGLN